MPSKLGDMMKQTAGQEMASSREEEESRFVIENWIAGGLLACIGWVGEYLFYNWQERDFAMMIWGLFAIVCLSGCAVLISIFKMRRFESKARHRKDMEVWEYTKGFYNVIVTSIKNNERVKVWEMMRIGISQIASQSQKQADSVVTMLLRIVNSKGVTLTEEELRSIIGITDQNLGEAILTHGEEVMMSIEKRNIQMLIVLDKFMQGHMEAIKELYLEPGEAISPPPKPEFDKIPEPVPNTGRLERMFKVGDGGELLHED